MSRYWDAPATIERRIYRGLIVQSFGPDDVDAFDYIRQAKQCAHSRRRQDDE